MNLTKAVIARFSYRGDGSKRDIRWDKAVPGLGVRIYPSGRKAFVLSYRVGPTKRLMTLGDFDERHGANLDEVRRRARRQLAKVDEGKDPLEEKRAAGRAGTFGELMAKFIEDQKARGKKTWAKAEKRIKRHVPSTWNSRKAEAITSRDVADLHTRVSKQAPYEANRLLESIRTAYNLAPVWRIVPRDHPNPAKGIKKNRETKRKRWVTPEEVRPLAAAIDAEPNIYVRAALWLYLLTGVRKTELLGARRGDVDWSRGVLRLPETKSGDEQSAPLSGPALAILQSIPALDGNPYLFPGRRKGRHLVNIDKRWDRIRTTAGVGDVRLHDLRRTVGSWMTQARVDLNTIKDALRHSNISTTLTYARLGADPAREAMEEHAQRLLAAAGREGPAEVVRMKR